MDNEKKYAFISYSTKNQQDADILRDILIKNHIGCWRAPDDIPKRWFSICACYQ